MVPAAQEHGSGPDARTFAFDVALAVPEGPPSPAARLGPIRSMGRAVCSRAHALTGQPERPDRAVDGVHVTCARAGILRAPDMRVNVSSLHEDHGDMRRVVTRGRLEAQHTFPSQLS